jgi:hypothetical protein
MWRGGLDFGLLQFQGFPFVAQLLLLARYIPKHMAERIFEQPDVFRVLAQCDDRQLQRFARSCIVANREANVVKRAR